MGEISCVLASTGYFYGTKNYQKSSKNIVINLIFSYIYFQCSQITREQMNSQRLLQINENIASISSQWEQRYYSNYPISFRWAGPGSYHGFLLGTRHTGTLWTRRQFVPVQTRIHTPVHLRKSSEAVPKCTELP